MCLSVLRLLSLGMLFILLILWFMMDFGGSRFDLDSCVHVASASVSLALLGAAVVPLSVVGASHCALALAGFFVVSSIVDMLERTPTWC